MDKNLKKAVARRVYEMRKGSKEVFGYVYDVPKNIYNLIDYSNIDSSKGRKQQSIYEEVAKYSKIIGKRDINDDTKVVAQNEYKSASEAITERGMVSKINIERSKIKKVEDIKKYGLNEPLFRPLDIRTLNPLYRGKALQRMSNLGVKGYAKYTADTRIKALETAMRATNVPDYVQLEILNRLNSMTPGEIFDFVKMSGYVVDQFYSSDQERVETNIREFYEDLSMSYWDTDYGKVYKMRSFSDDEWKDIIEQMQGMY